MGGAGACGDRRWLGLFARLLPVYCPLVPHARMVYLDNNATTRPAPEVVRAVDAALTQFWHNPSSVHRAGQAARQKVELARQSVAHNAALIAIPASGGARMQEGILSLMQMPRTTIAVQQVREAHLPYIVILTDPTTGGVSSSFAMLGDVTIAEPNALICFAGPRVIEETIREKLPEGFQRSEYLLEHGMVDMVVHRKDLRARLTTVLQLIMLPNSPQMKKRA